MRHFWGLLDWAYHLIVRNSRDDAWICAKYDQTLG